MVPYGANLPIMTAARLEITLVAKWIGQDNLTVGTNRGGGDQDVKCASELLVAFANLNYVR